MKIKPRGYIHAILIFFLTVYPVYAGQLKFEGVPVDITTADNEDLVIAPGSGGKTRIGIASVNDNYAVSQNDLFVSGILETGGAGYFDTTLTVTGALTANGNVILGDGSSDKISATGRLASDLLPNVDSSYNLGSSILAFSGVYAGKISSSDSALILSPASGYPLTGNVVRNAASGDETAYDLALTVDKSGSGNYCGLKLDVTETLAPGSANKLLDLQVSGNSRMRVYSGMNSADYGLLSLGTGYWDGSSSGHFAGSADGTMLAVNTPAGFTGNFIDLQAGGASRFYVDYLGNIVSSGSQIYSGDMVVGGDLAVNGGNLTTTATAFNLLNSGASTVNFAQGATNLSMGSSSGTTLVNNSLTAAKGLTLSSGALNLSATSGALSLSGLSPSSISTGENTFVIASGGESYWSVTNGNLALSTLTSGNLALTSAGSLNLAAGASSSWTLPDSTSALNIASGLLNIDTINSRIGVGTASPAQALDVAGTGRFSAGLITPKLYPDVDSATAVQINKADGTTNVVNIDTSNGRVGIGTTAPSSPLTINASSADPQFRITRSSRPAQGMTITAGAGTTKFTSVEGTDSVYGQYQFDSTKGASTVTRMYINSAGNVGIGTTSPAYNLDVSGDIRATGTIYGASGTQVPVGTGTENYLSKWSASGTLGDSVVYDDGTKVGIGTTEPEASLHTNGAMLVTGSSVPTSAAGVRMQYSGGQGDIVAYDWGSSSYKPLALRGAPVTITGNVGIGTTSPGSRLVVQGTTTDSTASGLNVIDNSGASVLFVRNDGKVGIGTETPSLPLTIDKSSNPAIAVNVSGSIRGTLAAATASEAYSNFATAGDVIIRSSNEDLILTAKNSSGAIRFGAGNPDTEKVTILNSGNVGIGTTSPAYNLDVSGDIRATGTIYGASGTQVPVGTGTENYLSKWSASGTLGDSVVYDDGTKVGIGTTAPSFPLSFGTALGNKIALYDSGSGNGYGFGIQASLLQVFSTASDTDITFGYGNSSLMTRNVTFKGNGTVGIGTTVPGTKLHVYDDNTAVLKIEGGTTSTPARRAILDLKGNQARATGILFENAYNPWFFGTPYLGGDTLQIGKHATQPEYPANAFVTISSTGNVGIGTTSPAYKLDVRAVTEPVVAALSTTANDPSSGRIIFGVATGAAMNEGGVLRYDGSANQILLGSNISDGIIKYHRDASTDTLMISSTGNVGIGTTSPAYNLDVSGDIRATGTIYGASGTQVPVGTGTENYLSKWSASGTLGDSMVYDDGTNVGIGTASPTTLLEIAQGDIVDMSKGLSITKTGQNWRLHIDTNNALNIRDVTGTTNKITIGNTVNGNVLFNTGNVGIGTTAPAAKLDVYGAIKLGGGTYGGITYSDTPIANNTQFFSGYGRALLLNAGDVNDPDITILSSGNVGIGTTAPGEKMHIYGATGVVRSKIQAGAADGYATFQAATDAGDLRLGAGGSTATSIGAAGLGYLGTFVNKGLQLVTNGNERMRIDNLGNVGIGTTSPAYNLDVSGDIRATGTIYGASGTQVPVGTGTENYLSKWSASGTLGDSVVYDDGTNVGIGTTEPSYVLDVNGAIRSTTRILSGATTASAYVSIANSSRWWDIVNDYSDGTKLKITDVSAGATRMTIDTSGNVGIGTTGPTSKVHIWVNEIDNALTLHRNTTIAGDTVALNFGLTTGANPSANLFGAVKGVRIGGLALYDGGDTGTLQETMRLYKGNVGIGTTSPATKLDVNGTLGVSADSSYTTSSGAGFVFRNSTSPDFEMYGGYDMSIDGAFLQGVQVNNIVKPFYINPRGSNVSIGRIGTGMIVQNSGNVGIGTTSPAYTLDVSGDIRATGTIYGASGTQVPVGTGTENYLSKWSASGTLGDSVVYDDGTNVGIGTTDITRGKIEIKQGVNTINGGIGITNSGVAGSLRLWVDASNIARISSGGTEASNLVLNGEGIGNVGIGTTSPSEKLDVSGATNTYVRSVTTGAAGSAVFKAQNDGTASINMRADGSGLSANSLFGLSRANLLELFSQNGGLVVGTLDANDLTLGTNNTANVTIKSAGNVGIGTTAPGAKLDISGGNLDLDSTTNANQFGVITKDGIRFIHDFNYGNNGTVTTTGQNTFLGLGAGNLTIGSTATQVYHGSYNTGVGYQVLQTNTTGYYNSALGRDALRANTIGYSNSALGMISLRSNTTGNSNSVLGVGALYSNTTGNFNSALGKEAGRYLADGTGNETSNNSLFLGYDTRSKEAGQTNEIVIGASAIGAGSNSVTLGNDSIATTLLKGNVGIGTTAPASALHVVNTGSAYPAVRIGAGTNSLHYNGSKDGSVLVQGTDGGRSQLEVLSPDGVNRVIIQALSGNNGSYLQAYGGIATLNVTNSTFKFNDDTGTKGITFATTASTAPDVTIYRTGVGLLSISGNVGIGTTSPAYNLDVSGDIRATGTIYGASGTQVPVGTGTENYLSKWSASGTLGDSVVYDDGANVGIGTTAPEEKLHIGIGNILLDNSQFFKQKDSSGTARQVFVADSSNNLYVGSSTGWTGGLVLQYPNTAALKILSGASEKVRIDSTGNVGIGTAEPFGKLHVSYPGFNPFILERNDDSAFAQGLEFRKGRNGVGVQAGDQLFRMMAFGELNDGTYASASNHQDFMTAEATDSFTSVAQGRQSSFYVVPTGSIAQTLALRLLNNGNVYMPGNVGIGTTAPGDRLELATGVNPGLLITGSNTTAAESGSISFASNADNTDTRIRLVNDEAGNILRFDVRKTKASAWTPAMSIIRSTLGLGNVGIGTTSPAYNLDVSGDIRATGTIYGASGTQVPVGTGTENYLSKWSASGTLGDSVLYDDGTNVGIGTTAPGAKLEVSDNVAGHFNVLNLFNTNSNRNTFLYLGNSKGTGRSLGIGYQDNSGGEIGYGWLAAYGDAPGSSLVIKKGGNVGIGTTTPATKLDILGDLTLSTAKTGTASRQIGMRNGNNISLMQFDFPEATSIQSDIRFFRETNNSVAPQFIIFKADGTNSPQTSFSARGVSYINAISGNVGIGTTSPAYTLDVSGDIRATGTIYGASGTQVPVGTGTENYLSKWSASGTLGDSVLYDDGTNVGIGTTTPEAKLHVAGAQGTRIFVSDNLGVKVHLGDGAGTDQGGLLLMNNDSGITNVMIRSYGDSYFNAGNVGIGTTAPGQMLDIAGKVVVDGVNGRIGIGTTSPGAKLDTREADSVANGEHFVGDFYNVSGSAGVNLGWRANGSALTGGFMRSIGSLPLFLGTTNSTQALTILDNGNVGIGTTTPDRRLTVKQSESNVPAILVTRFDANDISYKVGIGEHWDATNGEAMYLYSAAGVAGGLDSSNVKMAIFSNGNVGIGTTSPAYNLDVSGDIRATGTIYGASGTQVPVGTGTENYLSKWSASGTLGDSVVYDDGTNVGIGTTAPDAKLQVAGNIHSSSIETNVFKNNGDYQFLNKAGDAWLTFGHKNTTGSESVYDLSNIGTLTTSGNVGIGTTEPDVKLDVAGRVNIGTLNNSNGVLTIARHSDSFPWGIIRGGLADNDTGVGLAFDYRTSAGVATTGVLLDSFGNVGIGTTTPGAKLNIVSTGAIHSGSPSLLIEDTTYRPTLTLNAQTDKAQEIVFKNQGTTKWWFSNRDEAAEGSQLRFYSGDGIARLAINQNGNVGIGTTAPGTQLEVMSASGGIVRLKRDDIIVSGGELLGELQFYSNDNNLDAEGVRAKISAFNKESDSDGIKTNLAFYTVNGVADNLAEAMRIDESGNVGIGTTSPAYTLDVSGDIRATGTIYGASGTQVPVGTGTENYLSKWSASGTLGDSVVYDDGTNVGIGTTEPSYVLDVNGAIRSTTRILSGATTASAYVSIANSSRWWDIVNDYSDGTKLKITDVSAGATRMTIDTSGNVGIGTTGPTSKVHIWVNEIDNALTLHRNTTIAGDTVALNFGLTTGANPSANLFGAVKGVRIGGLALYDGGDTGTLQETMRLYKGNVGIGTTTPGAKLDIAAGNLDLDNTTFANQFGVITKDGTHFLHDFNYGNNGTVTTDGLNTFLGLGAGNLTMGSTATQTYHSSQNTGVGYQVLQTNTTGHYNAALGSGALHYNTSGNQNSAVGMNALRANTSGSINSALGRDALLSNTTGHSNSALGTSALRANTTGYSNVAMGASALYSNTTGYSNSALGRDAGRYLADGATGNEASNNSLFLGYGTRSKEAGQTNEIVIGASAIGAGSNSVTLGNDSITKTLLKGNVGIGTTSPVNKFNVAGANDSSSVGDLSLIGITNTDPTNNNTIGFGFNQANASGTIQTVAGIDLVGVSHTDGAQSGALAFATRNAGSWGERLRIDPSGNVGVGTDSPSYVLDVQHASSKVNSKNGYLTNGADYAEYFENEEIIPQGALVGMNMVTGKVHKYAAGDEFIGIVSSGGGFVGNGNKDIEKDSNYTLVGLLGQLDFVKEETIIENRIVYTKDRKRIGILLSSGKVLLR